MASRVRDLDHSPIMQAYFAEVANHLEKDHGLSSPAARHLVDRYFSIGVAPLERVLTMHDDPSIVAADLASSIEYALGKAG